MNMNIKGNLINFKNYLTMAETHAKLGNRERTEYFLVAADVARDNVYREDKNYPGLAMMAEQISEARKNLLKR